MIVFNLWSVLGWITVPQFQLTQLTQLQCRALEHRVKQKGDQCQCYMMLMFQQQDWLPYEVMAFSIKIGSLLFNPNDNSLIYDAR